MKKRKKSFPKITVLLLAASAVLLVGSGVGSARAALTYYSENYSAQMNMQSIMYQIMNGQATQRVHCLQICWVRMRSLHRANAMTKPSA